MKFQSNHHLNLNKYHSFLMTLFLYLSTFFTFVIFWTLRKLSIMYQRMRNSKVVFEHLSRRKDLCTPTPTRPWASPSALSQKRGLTHLLTLRTPPRSRGDDGPDHHREGGYFGLKPFEMKYQNCVSFQRHTISLPQAIFGHYLSPNEMFTKMYVFSCPGHPGYVSLSVSD